MTKKNKAALNNLVIKSTEDLHKKAEKPTDYGFSSSVKGKKNQEPHIIDTQPKPRDYIKSASAVDGGLMLNFFPLASQMEKVVSSLETLKPVSRVLISQVFDIDDTSSSVNQYLIKNDKEEEMFFAVEQSSWFERVLFGPSRTFTMSITDCNHQIVMKIRRSASCSMCIPPFQHACLCLNKVYVSAPPGIFAGSVNSVWALFGTTFEVRDSGDVIVYRIKGKRSKFDIYDKENEIVGFIQPEGGSDPVRAMYAEYQHFAINFPQDATIELKAVLIGAVFLIDFLYFDREKKGKGAKYDGIQKATIIGV